MVRHGGSKHSADALVKGTLSCLLLAGAGAIGGMFLGEFVVGESLHGSIPASANYADLSSNPDAIGADGLPSSSCHDCADGYVPATRVFAARHGDGFDAFDPSEPVTIDYASPAPADDGYRYGGTFADVAPPSPAEAMAREVGDSRLLVLPADTVPDAPVPAPVPIPAANQAP
ncbi:hypothetical protein [Sphingopyxis sp. GW247-27LB]|uniref:hypothetical protein n=1 Tax=Sphingopyxis sp. GW247-27LB TaxID=2012632 RepID=UPI000BA62643|nr:hypothetical protein [Sphingopyxis sp. GW247-27LB]PAL25217.1 hypothetical protein CD928_01545 [Sphingopyxis sp. GW247-27LB]